MRVIILEMWCRKDRENQKGKLELLAESRGLDRSAAWRTAELKLPAATTTEMSEYTQDQSWEQRTLCNRV